MKKIVLLTFILLMLSTSDAQNLNQAKWQQQVDTRIEVLLNDTAHTITGNITITYLNNSPNVLTEMYIHLWPNGYTSNETAFGQQMIENGELDFYYAKKNERGGIDKICFSTEGADIPWDYAVLNGKTHKDIALLKLINPIKTGETRVISTPFVVTIPRVFSRLGHKEQDYFISQWYPKPAVYDVNGWNPMPYLNMGEFYSEFGSFDVSVVLPQNYTVVATGVCQSEGELQQNKFVESDSTPVSDEVYKTVRFTAKDVHDFAWFASKRWGYVSKKITVNGQDVTLRAVAAKPDTADLKHIEMAIQYYSNKVGAYPYSHATVVHGELKAGGGMEYPMITLCDYMDKEVIVHEVGHNWFYGILANNERDHPWMDESINSFYEAEAMRNEDINKKDLNSLLMLTLTKDNMLRSEHQAIASHSAVLTNANYGLSLYGIGAKSFGYLKAFLGDTLFDRCVAEYYIKWKFKHPLPYDMKHSFEQSSDKNLDWFFDEVLQSQSKMDYSIKRKKGGFVLANVGAVAAPVPVDFTLDGVKSTEWFLLNVNQQMFIPYSSIKGSAILDAHSVTLDLHGNNNSTNRPLKIKLVTGVDHPAQKELYVVPTFGWNSHDRGMLGLGIHNYSLSNKKLHYHLLPMYSLQNKKVNGEAAVGYTIPLSGKAQYIEMGAKVRRYSLPVSKRDYSFFKFAPYVEYHLPKSQYRSTVHRSVSLRYDFIAMSPQFGVNRSDAVSIVQNRLERSRQFVTAVYTLENKRNLNGYSWRTEAQYGLISTNNVLADKTKRSLPDSAGRSFYPYLKDSLSSENLLRISSVFHYDLDIGIKNKPLQLRVYGSYIINAPKDSKYYNAIGSTNKAAYYDYAMEDYLLHRNPTEGLFQNQISNRRDFSKFVGPIAENRSWLITANASVPLPGKIPIRPYIDLLLYDDINKATWNAGNARVAMSLGVELEVIKDRFEIFFNLAQTSDITSYQDGVVGGLQPASQINSFAERITFVLDLNGLVPSKLKQRVKLF